jgi:hypothetical protein
MVAAAKAWLGSYPDDTDFWVDHDRSPVCVWIEEVRRRESALLDIDEAVRFDVDRLLATLISLGVADAKRLEEALARWIWERSLIVSVSLRLKLAVCTYQRSVFLNHSSSEAANS